MDVEQIKKYAYAEHMDDIERVIQKLKAAARDGTTIASFYALPLVIKRYFQDKGYKVFDEYGTKDTLISW